MNKKYNRSLIVLMMVIALGVTGCTIPFTNKKIKTPFSLAEESSNEASFSNTSSSKKYENVAVPVENINNNENNTEKRTVSSGETLKIVDGISNKEAFNKTNSEYVILTVASSTCGHCVNFKPIAKEYASASSYTYYWIEIDKISDDERTKLVNSIDSFYGTPHTVVYKNGVVLDAIEGEVSLNYLTNRINDLVD